MPLQLVPDVTLFRVEIICRQQLSDDEPRTLRLVRHDGSLAVRLVDCGRLHHGQAPPAGRGRAGWCIPAGNCQNRLMLTLGLVVLGVDDVPRAVEFWRAALGYEARTDGFGGWATVMTPPGGAQGPIIALQRSVTPPQSHPRLHFDLHVADAAEQESEAARLVSLGAQLVDWDSFPDDPDFVVLADPDGNRLCIVDLSHDRA